MPTRRRTNSLTVCEIACDDFLGRIPQPRDNLDVIADETWNVTLEDCGVADENALVHHVRRVCLRDNCKEKK